VIQPFVDRVPPNSLRSDKGQKQRASHRFRDIFGWNESASLPFRTIPCYFEYMKTFTMLLLSLLVLGGGCSTNQDISGNPSDQPKKIEEKPASTGAATLDLSGRGLTSIPSDVFSKTNLESLDLSDNRLTGAPQAEIRHLQKLKILDLSGNDLTGLPAELGQLKNLEVLDVSDNRLTGLPLELGNLTQLRVLDITGNQYSKQDLDQIAAKLTNTEIRK